jgi:TolA-binding protein
MTNPFRSTVILTKPNSTSSTELQQFQQLQQQIKDLQHQMVSLSYQTGKQPQGKTQSTKKNIKR